MAMITLRLNTKATNRVDIEVDVNTADGRIDALWIEGENMIDKTGEEIALQMFNGPEGFRRALARAEDEMREE